MMRRSFPLSPRQENKKSVEVTITYLEQTERPLLQQAPHPPRKLAILRAENPPIHFYRYMYRLVGDPYNWVSRNRLDDDALVAIIHDPNVYIYVLYVEGVPGGFAEVDARGASDHEIKFFGLTPDFTGAGLGRYFLTNIIDLAWSHGPKRLLLETCTLDHPAALPLYQRLGFRVFDRKKGFIDLIEPSDAPA